jgi:hypothetical protein
MKEVGRAVQTIEGRDLISEVEVVIGGAFFPKARSLMTTESSWEAKGAAPSLSTPRNRSKAGNG